MINYRFILIATLTYIPFTVLWFFWHNNVFHGLYYSAGIMYPINSQNIWAMNFANALLVYGFVYFYFLSVKPDTRLFKSILLGVYYIISVIGFFCFLNFGMLKEWDIMVLINDLIFAVIGGIIIGVLVYNLYKRFHKIYEAQQV